MYELKDAPEESLWRELHNREAAINGVVLRGYTAEEIALELVKRAQVVLQTKEAQQQGSLLRYAMESRIERGARLLATIETGLGELERPKPVTETATEDEERQRAFDAELHQAPDREDEERAERIAQQELKALIRKIGKTYGVRGAKGFIEWMNTSDAKQDEFTDVLLGVERTSSRSADAILWYAANDDRGREIRLSTVEKWLSQVPTGQGVGSSIGKMEVQQSKNKPL